MNHQRQCRHVFRTLVFLPRLRFAPYTYADRTARNAKWPARSETALLSETNRLREDGCTRRPRQPCGGSSKSRSGRSKTDRKYARCGRRESWLRWPTLCAKRRRYTTQDPGCSRELSQQQQRSAFCVLSSGRKGGGVSVFCLLQCWSIPEQQLSLWSCVVLRSNKITTSILQLRQILWCAYSTSIPSVVCHLLRHLAVHLILSRVGQQRSMSLTRSPKQVVGVFVYLLVSYESIQQSIHNSAVIEGLETKCVPASDTTSIHSRCLPP